MKVAIGFHLYYHEGSRMVCVEADLETAMARTIQLAEHAYADELHVYELPIGTTVALGHPPSWRKIVKYPPEGMLSGMV